MSDTPEQKIAILHICKREVLRPLRDAILRLSGYEVTSTCDFSEAVDLFHSRPFSLVLIDVEGEEGIPLAEDLCATIKKAHHAQLVAFVCNWRVAILTDCPDHIVRTEFDPEAFVSGVREMLKSA
jgi:DNA-binding response OmpR family regulator